MESDLLCLNLAVLNINLVTNKDNGNILANTDEILVPLGNVLVGDARAHIKHDNGAVATNATGIMLIL